MSCKTALHLHHTAVVAPIGEERGQIEMNYEDIEIGVRNGIIAALSDEETKLMIVEIISTVIETYMTDSTDPDFPDEYKPGHSLHLICDSAADIAKSLQIISGRYPMIDREELHRRYDELRSYVMEYSSKTNKNDYDAGVVHGLLKGVTFAKWVLLELESEKTDAKEV